MLSIFAIFSKNKYKQYKSILVSFSIFFWFFLNQSEISVNNIILLSEPIFCKITYFLNDSISSVYTLTIIYFIFWKTSTLNNKKLIVLFTIYIYISQVFWHNKNIFDFVYFTKTTNHTLINGLLLIHPILLYVAGTGVILIFINQYFFKKNLIKLNKSVFLVKNKVNLYSSLALFLGCYWAQQETNWGGWWNWDPVEIIAFVLWLYSVYYIHVFFKNIFIFSKYFAVGLNLIIISYFLSRYDILNSIHSFAPSSKSSKYLELKLSIVLCLTFYFLNISKKINFNNNIMLFLTFCVLISVLYSILLQCFDISNNNFDYRKELLFVLIIYSVFSYNHNFKKNSMVFMFYNYSFLFFLNLFEVFFFFNKKYKNHIFIVYAIVLIIIFSRVDVFIKSYEYKSTIGHMINLNHKWFNKIYINSNYNDHQSYIQSKTSLYLTFDLKKRFFYQTILSNFYNNQNYVNINTTLIFFQQKLFLIISLFICISIYLIFINKKTYIKAV